MIITVTSFKGGVGKTTTAIHLATYLQAQADTLLIDADPNHSATGWASRGSVPFEVVDEWRSPRQMRQFNHVVIDTQARPVEADLAVLADSCDLLVLPTTPDILALDALVLSLEYLNKIEANRYCILLSIVPPQPSREGDRVRTLLLDANQPVFAAEIPRLAAFQKAAQMGIPVYAVRDPKAKAGWQAYQQLGQELLTRIEG